MRYRFGQIIVQKLKRLPAHRLQYSYHAGVWALIIIGFGFEARERF